MTETFNETTLLALLDDLREHGGERTDIEVKSGLRGVPGLGETLSAFANTPDGGTILIGINEHDDFHISGIDHVADYEKAIASQARDTVIPPVQCDFDAVEVEGKNVLVVTVHGLPMSSRPARFRGQAYLRQADGDYELSQQEISYIELLKTQQFSPTHPDRDFLPGTSKDDLDQDIVSRYVSSVRTSSRRMARLDDDEILYRTAVINRSGEVSMAGLYAMGVAPQRLFPQLSVTAAVRLDPLESEGRVRDLEHFVGPIPDLLDQAMEWVRRNIHSEIRYNDAGGAYNSYEIPLVAVREIIANALVHRNLDAITASKRVEVRLWESALTVWSPGGLWGVSEQQLGKPGGKSAVNPTLYDMCTNVRMPDGVRVIEGEGGGIAEAVRLVRAAHLREPVFTDSGISFAVDLSRRARVELPRSSRRPQPATSKDSKSQALEVIASLRRGEEWTARRVADEFHVDAQQARSILKKVADLESVQKNRRGRATVYKLAKSEVMTKNGEAVLQAFEGPTTVDALAKRTSLSEGQVRFALRWLIEHGHVVMDGGQGSRNTAYRLTEALQ